MVNAFVYGGPGTGKTTFLHKISNTLQVVSGTTPDPWAGVTGELKVYRMEVAVKDVRRLFTHVEYPGQWHIYTYVLIDAVSGNVEPLLNPFKELFKSAYKWFEEIMGSNKLDQVKELQGPASFFEKKGLKQLLENFTAELNKVTRRADRNAFRTDEVAAAVILAAYIHYMLHKVDILFITIRADIKRWIEDIVQRRQFYGRALALAGIEIRENPTNPTNDPTDLVTRPPELVLYPIETIGKIVSLATGHEILPRIDLGRRRTVYVVLTGVDQLMDINREINTDSLKDVNLSVIGKLACTLRNRKLFGANNSPMRLFRYIAESMLQMQIEDCEIKGGLYRCGNVSFAMFPSYYLVGDSMACNLLKRFSDVDRGRSADSLPVISDGYTVEALVEPPPSVPFTVWRFTQKLNEITENSDACDTRDRG